MPRQQLHCGLHLRIFDLKDSKNKLTLKVSGTLTQILGVIYEIVQVQVLGCLKYSFL